MTSDPGAEKPPCPIFGVCGGCAYQDISYEEELRIKERALRAALQGVPGAAGEAVEAIVPSPRVYAYRHRLDLTLLKKKFMDRAEVGFMPRGRFRVLAVDACAIAEKPISDFIPRLKEEAEKRLPAGYQTANLVLKTGDDGRVVWGGIGRRSLFQTAQEYLWTDILGRRIHFALDTFFQANRSILETLIRRIRAFPCWTRETVLFDLYSGVGLFGILLAPQVKEVVRIEENPASVRVANYNLEYNKVVNARVYEGKVEQWLPKCLDAEPASRRVLFLDPPRKGLDARVLEWIASLGAGTVLYLSCQPASLARDLVLFEKKGWRLARALPFDFFPRTEHLETLAVLEKGAS